MTDPDITPTQLLERIQSGDENAQDLLLSLVYSELRQIAELLMKGERPAHTLQPTALVNEAWLRLFGGQNLVKAENGPQFMHVAGRAMHHVLVDHARKRQAQKRGDRADLEPGVLDLMLESFRMRDLDLLAIHEALERLAEFDEVLVRVVELRFFAGLSVPEVARAMEVSVSTVERHWRLARAWLRAEVPRPGGLES